MISVSEAADIARLERRIGELEAQLKQSEGEMTASGVARAALKDSEAKLLAILNAAPVGILVAEAPNGRIVGGNRQCEEILGHPILHSTNVGAYGEWVAYHPDGRRVEASEYPLARAMAGEERPEIEVHYQRGDGTRRWVRIIGAATNDSAGRRAGAVVMVIDIDREKRAEVLIRESNVTLTTDLGTRTRERDRIWDTTNDLMGTAGLDGYLKSVNPAWTRMLGWEADVLLARPFLDLIDPIDHAETADVVGRLSRGETVRGFVDHLNHKDGGQRIVMWDAVPVGDTFDIVGRDITALRKAEEALRQSQKMEAVGQLTGGLAHDFNNMLAGITGSLELIDTRVTQGRFKDIHRYVAAAQGAAKRAAALTHRLLAFSRRQTLDPRPTDLNRLVAGMEDMIRRSVGPSVIVESVAAGGLWTCLVDASQLENALLNLCINAGDAMPDGGKVMIETGNRWLDERAADERDVPPGQYVSLCVSDTGTGMTPDIVAKAFDPFFTTKPLGQGTGLGLSMIYGFAKQSGGQCRIYSEVGKGTMICLYLPRHLGEADVAEDAAALSDVAHATTGDTVLVVDDEPTVRMLVLEVLDELGYAAIEAADGKSGLRILESDARIDLLVTDIGLPGQMNGRQMAEAARAKRPDLKVLFITGFAENAALSHGHLGVGTEVMTKPFAMEALGRRIKAMIG